MELPLAFTIVVISCLSIFGGHATRVPFEDLLKQVSTPKPNEGYQYVMTLYPFAGLREWAGECFQNNVGYLTYDQAGQLGYVVITAHNAKSRFCKDYYEFKVGDRTIATDSIFLSSVAHDTAFDSSDRELKRSIKASGVAVYVYRSGNRYVDDTEISKKQMDLPMKDVLNLARFTDSKDVKDLVTNLNKSNSIVGSTD